MGNPPATVCLDKILVKFLVLDDDAGLVPTLSKVSYCTLVLDEHMLTGLQFWKRLSVLLPPLSTKADLVSEGELSLHTTVNQRLCGGILARPYREQNP